MILLLIIGLSFLIVAVILGVRALNFARVRSAAAVQNIDLYGFTGRTEIDLLVVTVEAGVSFNESLRIASNRIGGALGQELRLTMQEQTMGLALNEALQNLLLRAETPGLRSFIRSVLQGETLGVSIGQILRNVAVEMRKRRRALAEERAQKAPIKILFPLVFMIFPAIFVIILAPAVYALLDAFHK